MALEPKDVNPTEEVVPATTRRKDHSLSDEFFPSDGNTFVVIALEATPANVAAVRTALLAAKNKSEMFSFFRWGTVSHKTGCRAMVRVGMNCDRRAPLPI